MQSQSFLCLSPIIFTFGRNERSSRPEVFCKKGVFGNCAKFTVKHRVAFLKSCRPEAQVISCEFCAISKNTFYYRKPLVAAS